MLPDEVGSKQCEQKREESRFEALALLTDRFSIQSGRQIETAMELKRLGLAVACAVVVVVLGARDSTRRPLGA